MGLLRRVFGGARGQEAVPSLELCDSSRASGTQDSLRADTVLAALDIDAAINAHERWKTHLMDYLEGRTTEGLDPAEVRRSDRGALGRWLHGVGGELLGDQPAYFHEQAAMLVELAQQGEWDKAVQVLHGGYRYGSSQVVLLLKELKRGLVQQA
jgi:hypothetical protein